MPRPLSELAQEALDVQDACNLSGVVSTFAKVLDDIWHQATTSGHGTDWVNTHPITKAFTSKLVALSGWKVGDGAFHDVIGLSRDAT